MSAGRHISDEQIIAVIDRVADGISLKKSCEDAGFEYNNVLRRIRADDNLRMLDARAREDYQRVRVDSMDEVVRTEADVNKARLMCDNIKWEAARVARKTYGDKIDLNHSGEMTLKAVPDDRIESRVTDLLGKAGIAGALGGAGAAEGASED